MYSAIYFLLPLYIFTALHVLEFGFAETLQMKITLTEREDGYKVATFYIGNATSETIKNMGLEIDINATVDNFTQLIGAHGIVRETKRNKKIELNICSDTPNEEMELLCPEEGESILNITSSTGWGSRNEVVRENATGKADLIIVDGVRYNYSGVNYFAKMRRIETFQVKHFGDLLCNFFISDDGNVLEGIGWDTFHFARYGGLWQRSLIVGFIKKERDAAPSPAAISAFKELVKIGMCTKKLMPNYRLVPSYLIYDYHTISSDSFERNGMRKWESYVENLDFLFPVESNEDLATQIVPRDQWSEKREDRDLFALPSPVEYLITMQYGARCFFNCTNYVKVFERDFYSRNVTLTANFLLAEDGNVFEVHGWRKRWSKNYKQKKAIIVGFLGKFHSYGPRNRIFLAFNRLIIDGLRSGFLSPNYKILTINRVDPNHSSLMGKILEEQIQKLTAYSSTF